MTTPLTREQLTDFIRRRDFSALFIRLGWDKENLPSRPYELSLKNDDRKFSVQTVAEKRGFTVCVCDAGKDYPNRNDRRRLTTQLAHYHYEHLLILRGEDKQCWSVAIRPQNRPLRSLEVEWREMRDIQPLMEKLDGMIFSLAEEDNIGITDVVERVRSAFIRDAERVTKRFYDEFRGQLLAFSGFISGIREKVSKDWYAALMLNRLMFIYFIQKKRFLDGDPDYLENRLQKSKEQYGDDKFHDRFYRKFLRRLFAEGLGTPQAGRDPALQKLLGNVPYLNGGLFDLHAIERENRDITIPDSAFEELFAFFRKYNWRLDTRADTRGNEINPDVIGYIFEKYINDRAEMGAYYTQEDVTNYIARNTIIPFLLHRTREKCKNAFDADNGIWRFPRKKPDNYIYDSVKRGCGIDNDQIPENIRRGMDENTPDLRVRREDWNRDTEERFALPTEIWRETIARRERYFALREKLAAGEIREIDDLITHNLDIERFASDALREYEGSDFVAAFYESIAGKRDPQTNEIMKRGISVLDPACGSGAFLFAALNILEPLYAQCIERMRDFVAEDDALREQGERKGKKRHEHFRAVLADIAAHPNPRYWIYKTIILNNLYGVDLMKEAAEIAKLRLFLKLAAEAEYADGKENLGLEPLPDIDFNIRAGNSLVGFANMKQFEEFVAADASGQKLLDLSSGDVEKIREEADLVAKAHAHFLSVQHTGGDDYPAAKQALNKGLAELNGTMNRYLASQYGIGKGKAAQEKWIESHRPFHWLAEFYGIIESDGGFDVVIGNPPYVEYREVQYKVRGYATEKCGNLYAMFVERARALCRAGRSGMIVQLPIVCTDRMIPLQNLFLEKNQSAWFLTFDDRPAKLFADLQHIRAAIFLTSPNSSELLAAAYRRWNAAARSAIFEYVTLGSIANHVLPGVFPKIGEQRGRKILDKLAGASKLANFLAPANVSDHACHYHNAPQYWIRATDFVPYFWNERDGEKQSDHVKTLRLQTDDHAVAVCAMLNSSLFYWWFIAYSACRNVDLGDIKKFPFNPGSVSKKHLHKLQSVNKKLMADYLRNAERKEATYRTTGRVAYDEFHPGLSKPIIDEIDCVFAEHYGLTDSELDYIINYDIKYRMGLQR